VGSFTITSGTLSGQGTLHASSYALLGGEIRAILGAGAITVSTGTTTLVGSRLNDASSLTITSGNLTLGGAETVAALSGSGGTLNVGSHTITVNQTSDQTFSGVITGSGGLTKNGAGTLTLNGTNSYNGSTIVNSGTLEAKSAGALGSNNTVQINGGTLLVGADDAINGKNITLNTNGVGLRFSGNYSGAIGSLTLNADSIIDMGPGSVQILFQGLSLSSHTLSFYNWTGSTLWNGGTGADTDKVFLFPTIEPGDLNNISFYSGNGGDSFLGTGFDIGLKATGFSPAFGNQILPVPEPETWATAVILLVGGMVWFLKRARHPLKKKAVPIPHGSLNETE
jgi:autotransporter-associated beta strand protein